MRRPVIQLRNEDGSHSRYLTSSEVTTLLQKKEAVRISSRKGAAFQYKLLPQPEPLRTLNEFSAPSITMSDMLANAGLIASRSRTYEAKAKVEEFSKNRFRATPRMAFA